MTTDTATKVRENKARRMAERQGLALVKTRRRDSRAVDYGSYKLVDSPIPGFASRRPGPPRGPLTLDELERWLAGETS